MRTSHQKITIVLSIILLTKLSLTEELGFLIHPRYFWLVYSSIILLLITLFLAKKTHTTSTDSHCHHQNSKKSFITNLILTAFLITGIFIKFQPLTSFAQEQKVTANSSTTIHYGRAKRLTQFSANTEDRDLQDWVTFFSINPEPTKYEGQKAKLTGFYYIDTNGTPFIARYTLNCCAADARIISIPLTENLNYPGNTWLNISGTLRAIEEPDRHIALEVSQTEVIPTPSNPYIVD